MKPLTGNVGRTAIPVAIESMVPSKVSEVDTNSQNSQTVKQTNNQMRRDARGNRIIVQ